MSKVIVALCVVTTEYWLVRIISMLCNIFNSNIIRRIICSNTDLSFQSILFFFSFFLFSVSCYSPVFNLHFNLTLSPSDFSLSSSTLTDPSPIPPSPLPNCWPIFLPPLAAAPSPKPTHPYLHRRPISLHRFLPNLSCRLCCQLRSTRRVWIR